MMLFLVLPFLLDLLAGLVLRRKSFLLITGDELRPLKF